MQPEPKHTAASGASEEITKCPNCHVAMPSAMRFCRLCGFRLGEGVAEYAETVRLPNRKSTAQAQAGTSPNGVRDWSAMAHAGPRQQQQPAGQASAHFDKWEKKRGCKSKRAPWFLWIVLGVTIASVTGGGLLSPFGLRSRSRSTAARNAARSYVGTSELKTTTGGATFDYVNPPGSAADKAGLIGGDVITTFDGQQVTGADQLMKLLVATPVGKTVEVVYIRDGQTKTTQMTTISKEENSRLDELFDSRPEGKGYLGIDDMERVAVPGTNIYGVQVGDVEKNLPADMAGLRDGDIITEFDSIPIRTSRELGIRIDRVIPGSQVKVVVMRGGERLEIPVKVGKE
jgi:membrane-associated protease RseP (regulator of RpoE activity)